MSIFIAACPFVDILKGKEKSFLASLGIDGETLLDVCLYKFLTPPGEPHVLGSEIGVALATEIQVLKGE